MFPFLSAEKWMNEWSDSDMMSHPIVHVNADFRHTLDENFLKSVAVHFKLAKKVDSHFRLPAFTPRDFFLIQTNK